jgi:hypothetical protein
MCMVQRFRVIIRCSELADRKPGIVSAMKCLTRLRISWVEESLRSGLLNLAYSRRRWEVSFVLLDLVYISCREKHLLRRVDATRL